MSAAPQLELQPVADAIHLRPAVEIGHTCS